MTVIFIVEMRNALPSLLAAVRELTQERDAMKRELKSAADMLQAVACDLEDGGSLDTLRGKYVLAVLNASDRARAALRASGGTKT